MRCRIVVANKWSDWLQIYLLVYRFRRSCLECFFIQSFLVRHGFTTALPKVADCVATCIWVMSHYHRNGILDLDLTLVSGGGGGGKSPTRSKMFWVTKENVVLRTSCLNGGFLNPVAHLFVILADLVKWWSALGIKVGISMRRGMFASSVYVREKKHTKKTHLSS